MWCNSRLFVCWLSTEMHSLFLLVTAYMCVCLWLYVVYDIEVCVGIVMCTDESSLLTKNTWLVPAVPAVCAHFLSVSLWSGWMIQCDCHGLRGTDHWPIFHKHACMPNIHTYLFVAQDSSTFLYCSSIRSLLVWAARPNFSAQLIAGSSRARRTLTALTSCVYVRIYPQMLRSVYSCLHVPCHLIRPG